MHLLRLLVDVRTMVAGSSERSKQPRKKIDRMHDDARTRSAVFLNALANETRLEILENILDCEVTVGSLSERIGISQSALSQHLAKLRHRGLVQTRRDAQNIYYSTTNDGVRELLSLLHELFPDTYQNRTKGN